MSELAKQIEQFNNELATQVPQEVLEAFGKSIKDLKTKNIEEKSKYMARSGRVQEKIRKMDWHMLIRTTPYNSRYPL